MNVWWAASYTMADWQTQGMQKRNLLMTSKTSPAPEKNVIYIFWLSASFKIFKPVLFRDQCWQTIRGTLNLKNGFSLLRLLKLRYLTKLCIQSLDMLIMEILLEIVRYHNGTSSRKIRIPCSNASNSKVEMYILGRSRKTHLRSVPIPELANIALHHNKVIWNWFGWAFYFSIATI